MDADVEVVGLGEVNVNAKAGWFFEIHEDTPEETATNLMEHGACCLDISSDEESAARAREERGKENVAPIDDVSQVSLARSGAGVVSEETEGAELAVEAEVARPLRKGLETKQRRSRKVLEEGAIEVDRKPLGEMAAEEFWAEGCDGCVVEVEVAGEEADSNVPVVVSAPAAKEEDMIVAVDEVVEVTAAV